MLTEIRAKAAQSTGRAVAAVNSGSAARRVPTLSAVMMLTLMSVSSAASLPGSASAQAATETSTHQATTAQTHSKASTYAYTLPRFQEEAALIGIVVPASQHSNSGTKATKATNATKPKSTATTHHTQSSPASAPSTSSAGGNTIGQPCQSTDYFVANISQWTVPPSCFAAIYYPNPDNYGYHPSYGYCNWWPEVLNPTHPDILYGSEYTRSSVPIPGAVVWQAPYVQGASSEGHWAQVVAVSPMGWVLITEMNFYWRGGGYGKVDYRYIHVGSGITFIYP